MVLYWRTAAKDTEVYVSNPSRGRLLISHITLRGPELAQTYRWILSNPETAYDSVLAFARLGRTEVNEFGLDDATTREALNFLLIAGMVAQTGSPRARARFSASPLDPKLPFELLLLHHLSAHESLRHRALRLVHDVAVGHGIVITTVEALREELERSPYQDLFAWTGEKVRFWSHLMNFVGLTRRLQRSGAIAVVPVRHLLLTALRAVGASEETPTPVHSLLAEIETRFFACLESSHHVHAGVAQSLEALSSEGSLRLLHLADAAQSLLVGERRVSHLRLSSLK